MKRILVVLLLACGCSSGDRRESAGTQLPPVGGDSSSPTGRTFPEQGGGARADAPASEPARAPARAANDGGLGEVFAAAARDLARKIEVQQKRGWPATVRLSKEARPRPVLRLGELQNHSRQHADMGALQEHIIAVLVDQGLLKVLAPRREYEDLAEEDLPVPGEEAASVMVTGTFEDDVTETDDLKVTRMTVNLRLVDVSNGAIVLASKTDVRREQPRRRR